MRHRSSPRLGLRHEVAVLLLLSIFAVPGGAQTNQQPAKKSGPEFTRQGLLIVNFAPLPGADMKFARRVTDAVRSRVLKLADKKELEVIDGDDIGWKMERAGYNPDTTYSANDMKALGRFFRADEYVRAAVSNGPSGTRIRGELVLMRDERLRQPLAEVVAPRLDSAAQLFARSITSARSQFPMERRCENALRDGSGSRAIAAAREGIAVYSRSTIARVCLVWALTQTKAPPREIVAMSREILDVDSANFHALEASAIALDSLRERDQAANAWLRLAATDTNDLDLALRVSYSLLDGGNAKRAEPFIVALAAAHPDDIRFLQQKWRVAYENKSWPVAIAAGEVLLERDNVARNDSSFYLRLGTAYHSANRPMKAVETLAHGVATFPKDARLYSLYAQYVRIEADTVIPRGLALFPQSADLLAMNAKDLRARGKVQESLDATKRAVALDASMPQGNLMVAQLEVEVGRPDSALAALRRAIDAGEDSSLVAQFALAKGNTLYRAANGTKATTDFAAALRMLTFADSVRSSGQSRFLIGVAALGVAQTTLTDASKSTDKIESCRLTRIGANHVAMARAGLGAGDESFAEAAKQAMGFLDQLDPFAQQQLKLCGADPGATGTTPQPRG